MSETPNTQPESYVEDPDLAHDMANAAAPMMDKAIFHKNEAEEIQAETDQAREDMAEHDPYAQSGGHLDQEWAGDAEAEEHRQEAKSYEQEADRRAEEVQEAREEAHQAIDEDRELAAH